MPAVAIQDPVQSFTLQPEEIAFYQTEGYIVIPGLLNPDACPALRQEVLDIVSTVNGTKPSKLSQTAQYVAGTPVDALVNSAALHSVVSQLLEGDARLYLPFTAVKTAGGRWFEFHQDNMYTRIEGPALNAWFALNPMSPENGNLCVVPRSHVGGTMESRESDDKDGHRTSKERPNDFLHVRMRPGDCVIFNRLTLHGSCPNSTAEHRVGYAVQYVRHDVSYWVGDEHFVFAEKPRWDTAARSELTLPKKDDPKDD